MLARIRPASNNGQLTDGPKDQKLLFQLARLAGLLPDTASDPVNEKRGNRSAVATPMRAVAAWTCASARRMSGRRRNNSDGNPIGTESGTRGTEASFDNSSTNAPGSCPKRTAML